MPFADYEDFDACVRDNQDKNNPEAYCAEIKRSIEGAELSDREQAALEESTCPDGQVNINGECVPVESVDAPPSILSAPQHLTLKSLDTEPIERIEDGDNTVRYKSLKLLSPGIWADAGSQQETYYPPEGIANLEPSWDDSQHDGPPVNIMHDLDMDTFEAHEPSVAGHIDPDTLDTDDEGNLYADVVLDTATGAGQFADENLQSTLENQGNVGFGGPSVEIPGEGLQQSHDEVRDMPRVDGGLLTGVAMVMDPASKSVNFAREAARRPIAMSESNPNAKVFTLEDAGMSDGKTLEADPEQVREILDDAGVPTDELTDDEVMSMAESLHGDLMDELADESEGEGENGQEMKDDDYEDDEEEDDEDEGSEMQEDEPEDEDDDAPDDIEAIAEQVQNLSSRLEDVEDALSQAMTADDVSQELEDAAGNKLADADTVSELEEAKAELDRRLEALESQGKESKTLADNGDSDIDWSEADSGVDYDPATGSMSR